MSQMELAILIFDLHMCSGIAYAILQENSCPLFHLDLRLNPLEHEGALGIMRALVRTDKITELNLASCGFESDTAILFGMVLCMNSSLRVVDVSNNWFSDDGGEVRSYLVFLLYLVHCQAFQSILLSLADNRTIEWLDLRETDIPEECLWKINKLLERNRLKLEGDEEVSANLGSEEELNATEVIVQKALPEDQTLDMTPMTGI